MVNPFSLLAEKPVKDLVGAADTKKKQDEEKKKKKKKKKEKQKQGQKPKPAIPISTSTNGSLKSYNGGQHQQKGPADSVSLSSSTSTNDLDHQSQGSQSEEGKKSTKEVDSDSEGWHLVQHQSRKKGPRRAIQGQSQEAVGKKNVNVEEGIVNGGQGVKPRKPNVNGSARRKMQRQKAGAEQDQQFQAKTNAPAAAEDVTVEEKPIVSFTLQEFEMMMKDPGCFNISVNQSDQSAELNKKNGGHNKRPNDRSGDVLKDATVTSADNTSFSLKNSEFPILGKA